MNFDHEIFVGGKLNSDQEDRMVPNGELRDAVYFRMGTIERATEGTRTSFQGNRMATMESDLLPPGTNTVIGMCKWIEERAFLIYYHNSNGNHTILCFFTDTETFSLVDTSTTYLFDLNKPIIDTDMSGDLNSFTDGKDSDQYFDPASTDPLNTGRLFNPPWRINVRRGISGYPQNDLRSLEAGIWPPWYGPLVEYGSDPESPNFLRNLSFEFIYQFGAADGEWSTFSPLSDMPIPNIQEWVQGPNYVNPSNDNYIQLTIETGNWRIEKIRIAVRVNNGFFMVCEEINKATEGIADDTTYQYRFYNNNTLRPLSTDASLYPLNNSKIPQVANRQEYLPYANVLAYGEFTENYPNVEMDYTVSHEAIEIKNFVPDYANMEILSVAGPGTNVNIQMDFDSYTRLDVMAGQVYAIQINVVLPDLGPILLIYTITQNDIDQAIATHPGNPTLQMQFIMAIIRQAYADQINDVYGGVLVEVVSNIIQSTDPVGEPFNVTSFNRSSGNPLKPTRENGMVRSLKTGWRYYVAIQYYDRLLRDGTVQKKLEEQILDVPFPTYESARQAFEDPNSPYYVRLKTTINNLPPIWADSFKVVIRKVRTGFLQTVVHKVEVDPSSVGTYKISYDVYYNNEFGAKYSYTPQIGDVVRFVRQNMPTDIGAVSPYTQTYIETQVVNYDPSGGIGNRPCVWVSQFDLSVLGTVNYTAVGYSSQVMEVYQAPKQEDNSLWYEIYDGVIGDAHTENRYHKGTFGSFINVDSEGEIGDVKVATTVDVGPAIDPDGIRTIILVNADNETEEFTISSVEYNDSTFQWAIYVDGFFTYDFTAANGGRFKIKQDQIVVDGVSTTPAIIISNWGDIYVRQIIADTAFLGGSNQHAYYVIEDMSRSSFYPSNFYPFGRPAIENPENKRYVFKADVIHSGVYSDQTNRNSLDDFNGLDNRYKLNESNGAIQRMVASEKTLHVIQEACTTPIYNGTYSVAGDGEVAQPAFKDAIFGAKGREVPFGTIHPRTVQLAGNVIYLYDYHRATWAKLTDGGHASINKGQYTYATKAYEITRSILDNIVGNETMFSYIDELNKEYVTLLKIGLETIGYAFNYEKQGWSHRLVDHPMTWGENLFSYLISSNGTDIYIENSGEELEFYGSQKTPEFTFEYNAQGNLLKRPLGIGLKTDQLWRVTDIIIPPTVTYPTGMESEIPEGNFQDIEGYLWSSYLSDRTNIVPEDPELDSADKALVNGRDLLGPSARHTLLCQSSGPVTMFSILIRADLQQKPR